MVRLEKFVIHTTKYNDFINITDRVEELVEQLSLIHILIIRLYLMIRPLIYRHRLMPWKTSAPRMWMQSY